MRDTRVKGYQWAIGFTAPQIKIQVCPLFWGVAVSWSQICAAFQIGPIAVQIHWKDYLLERHAGYFGPVRKENNA